MKVGVLALALVLVFSCTAFSSPLVYKVVLDGPSEVPANASPGTGIALVTLDTAAHSLHIQASFSGLLGTTTASHIHCCTVVPFAGTAGVATITPSFTGFPLGVTSGTYDHTFDTSLASAWNPAFVTAHGTIPGAEAFFAAGLAAGESYLNIHSTFRPGGEIRGFLVFVPEPSTFVLMGAGLLSLVAISLRRRTA